MKILNNQPRDSHNPTGTPFHPCIHPRAHQRVARIHLPVAEKCNMLCRYCARQYANSPTALPGTSRRTMTPEQALDHLREERRIW